ncbi:hypothetical protein Droror1_Dr00015610 [Drosera rotundifolia]
MPRYYCDYCDTYLTHDSPSVRKQHNAGYKHKANVRTYYQQFEEQQTQSLIDQRIKEHLGQAAAFQQVGGPFAAWQRGRPPIMAAPPILPIPGSMPPGAPRIASLRPPVFPTPLPIPPGAMPVPLPVPGGPPTAPLQTNGLPMPPALNVPPTYPGAATTLGSTMTPAAGGQPAYQPIPSSGGFAAPPSMPPPSSFPNSSGGTTAPAPSNADSFPYPQAPSSGR